MEPNRIVYGRALLALGSANPRIIAMDADIQKSTCTGLFAERFPERHFNFGIAEQNMMAAAAGAATTGWIPFAHTFAVFASMRACEMVRTSVAYSRLNVKIVACNAGVEIAGDGVTHQAVEDIAIMRSFANMMVVSPSDPVTTKAAVFAIAAYDGPVYLRLGRQPNPVIHSEDAPFELGKMIRLREGRDVTIIATGNIVSAALAAADALAARGIRARVLDCHTVKPIDYNQILRAAAETAGIVTVEDHTIVGGLGSAVCEVVAEECPVPVRRVGLRDCFASSGRDYRKLLSHYGIDQATIEAAARSILCRRTALAATAPERSS